MEFILTPMQTYVIVAICIMLLISALYFIIKYEKNPAAKILWIIFNFILPVISSIVTIINFSISLKRESAKE